MNADEILERVLTALNSTLTADVQAVTDVIEHRVPCSQRMEGEGVYAVPAWDGQRLCLGALGLINGLCLSLTGERVMAVYQGGRIKRFQVYNAVTE